MNAILIKLFATALTLSQVTTRPDAVRTRFDPATDGPEVVRLLRDGCAHMRKSFDIEDINLDELISTAMEDPSTVAGPAAPKILHGLDINELNTSYKQFCKGENPANSPFDARAVIEFYDNATKDLPSAEALRDKALPGLTRILDGAGKPFAEASEPNGRRIVVPITAVPTLVQKAFIAAEDKRFESHHGIDERGVIRAFIGNLASPGRPAGGSTITQQVVKNLSVGDDVTYERKIREMIVASRLERILTKPQILGLYLNGIYLGRGAYGIEMAAQSYFGKPVSQLTLPEAALLAGMPKGPNFYSPDRYPDRARERRAYVLARLKDEGTITEAEMNTAIKADLGLKPIEIARRDSGFYVVDFLNREARTFAGVDSLTAGSLTVRSTINAGLQRAVEEALQDGLANYERSTGRQTFAGPELNLADSVRRIQAATPAPEASAQAAPGVTGARADADQAGCQEPQGREGRGAGAGPQTRLAARAGERTSGALRRALAPGCGAGDRPRGDQGRAGGRPYGQPRRRRRPRKAPALRPGAGEAHRRQGRPTRADPRPANRPGRGPRAGKPDRPDPGHDRWLLVSTQPAQPRHPGGAPAGLDPEAPHLPGCAQCRAPAEHPGDGLARHPPPINGTGESWSPKNYEGGGSGPTTLRRGLEFSKNLVTARLLQGGIAPKAPASLKRVCDIALEAQIYAECEPYYPFVLGAQPVRMLDLAGFYAAVANEGARPAPYALESVERDGKSLYTHAAREPTRIGSADRIAFYQLKTMLQGVTQHGTAAALSKVSPYVAGKTGTSENENDAWFAGLTNEISVVVWVGYDNADGSRKTLGRGQTGGHVSVPIAAAILQAAWANGVPKTALRGPSSEARPFIADLPVDPRSGVRVAGGGFLEHFRTSGDGRMADTQYRLVPRETLYAMRPDAEDGDLAGADDGASVAGDYNGNMTGERPRPDFLDPFGERPAPRSRRAQGDLDPEVQDSYRPWPGQGARSPFGDEGVRRPRRRDPDYLFGEDPGF